MNSFRRNAGFAPNLALALFLVAAQSLVSAHLFEHDPANAQTQVCTACVAASQLSSAAIDTGDVTATGGFAPVFDSPIVAELKSTHTLVVRQRGPPASL